MARPPICYYGYYVSIIYFFPDYTAIVGGFDHRNWTVRPVRITVIICVNYY